MVHFSLQTKDLCNNLAQERKLGIFLALSLGFFESYLIIYPARRTGVFYKEGPQNRLVKARFYLIDICEPYLFNKIYGN